MKFVDWYFKIAVVSAFRSFHGTFHDQNRLFRESEKRSWESTPEAQAIREALNPRRDHNKQTGKSS
ncbi:hypothetical protein Pfo_015977 [Paulownia fortunei]|nr:hypothetical protein Pfo_015977 [Paulownia fortunei]